MHSAWNAAERIRGERGLFSSTQGVHGDCSRKGAQGVGGAAVVEGRGEATGRRGEPFQKEVISMTTIQLESGRKFSRAREH